VLELLELLELFSCRGTLRGAVGRNWSERPRGGLTNSRAFSASC